jgi:sec-independent protein translocase protein TatC
MPDTNAQMQPAQTPTPGVPAILSPAADPAAAAPAKRGLRGRLRIPFRGPREPEQPKELSLADHLIELRNRIFISVLALLPGTVVGFVFGDELIRILKSPLPTDKPLIALSITEPFTIRFEIALVLGLVVGMPVILFQLWRFISPGLTSKERSIARPWVPFAMLFFLAGTGLAYFVLPYASKFLYGFQSADLQLMLTADTYFGFVTKMLITFGLVMEFPIILVLLSKVGIVSSKLLASNRRMAILIVTIVSALIAPGGDFVTPLALAGTMYGLYEGAIVVIRMGGH